MNTQECKQLEMAYHEATNTGDLKALDNIFAENFINHAAGFKPIQGCSAMKAVIKELLNAFPDWHVSVEDIFAEDNKVVVRWKFTGTHTNAYRDLAATQLKVNAEGILITATNSVLSCFSLRFS